MRALQDVGNRMQIAGVLTWAAVSGFGLYIAAARGGSTEFLFSLSVPIAVNFAAMWTAMGDAAGNSLRKQGALLIQLLSALAIGWMLPLSFMPIYTVVWIAIAASHYSLRTCTWLLVLAMVGWQGVMTFGWGEDHVIVTVALYATFHLFALLSAHNVQVAEAARERLEALNRELLATQHLLSEASRQTERTRIARDLHDLLGHHLTALSLNLQIAEHLAEGEVREKVEQSRALARLLLSDVREAVSALREESGVDFAQAIRLLVHDLPQLDVAVDVESRLRIDDVEIAETLLRCIQESLTNTLRHARATRSWIRVWREAGDLHMEARDNGVATVALREGNGISGMRERLQRLHGSLEISRVEEALCLHVRIPLAA